MDEKASSLCEISKELNDLEGPCSLRRALQKLAGFLSCHLCLGHMVREPASITLSLQVLSTWTSRDAKRNFAREWAEDAL